MVSRTIQYTSSYWLDFMYLNIFHARKAWETQQKKCRRWESKHCSRNDVSGRSWFTTVLFWALKLVVLIISITFTIQLSYLYQYRCLLSWLRIVCQFWKTYRKPCVRCYTPLVLTSIVSRGVAYKRRACVLWTIWRLFLLQRIHTLARWYRGVETSKSGLGNK